MESEYRVSVFVPCLLRHRGKAVHCRATAVGPEGEWQVESGGSITGLWRGGPRWASGWGPGRAGGTVPPPRILCLLASLTCAWPSGERPLRRPRALPVRCCCPWLRVRGAEKRPWALA